MPPSAAPSVASAEHLAESVLTIAGHDPSSGAGITADLQTFAAHGLFGTSAITALTVQSTLGVAGIQAVDSGLFGRVFRHLIADLPPAGIKIGMLGSAEVAEVVAGFLEQGINRDSSNASGSKQIPVVLDPILRASSGASLLEPGAMGVLHERLLPAVTWITPNWVELAALTDMAVGTLDQAEAAAHTLGGRQPHLHIVATGGDCSDPIDLLRLPSGEVHRFGGEHIETTSTHGTGCAFSSALLCRLVLGDEPVAAVVAAKEYVAEALRRATKIGHGAGPLDLLWPLTA